jgi:hypothetical protein
MRTAGILTAEIRQVHQQAAAHSGARGDGDNIMRLSITSSAIGAIGAIGALGLLSTVPVDAHHSYAATYDSSKTVRLEGELVRFESKANTLARSSSSFGTSSK